jgi:hypothetical protein
MRENEVERQQGEQKRRARVKNEWEWGGRRKLGRKGTGRTAEIRKCCLKENLLQRVFFLNGTTYPMVSYLCFRATLYMEANHIKVEKLYSATAVSEF